MTPASRTLLRQHLLNKRNACSVGGLGALAEFDESDVVFHEDSSERLSLRNHRGAIAINLNCDTQACAFESVSARENAWLCGVGFLYPLGRCDQAQHTLQELGCDEGAMDSAHRDDRLFDLGVGLPNVRFCIRTADTSLIAILRKRCGQSILDDNNLLIDEIIDAGPHRVALNPFARIEVYQKIDRHASPAGSHTHMLPDLLKAKRTHSANVPYPNGSVPLLTLHPENPLSDEFGHARPFNHDAFRRFDSCLNRFGWPVYLDAKNAMKDAFDRDDLASYRPAKTRVGRSAEKVALRQFHHLGFRRSQVEHWSKALRH